MKTLDAALRPLLVALALAGCASAHAPSEPPPLRQLGELPARALLPAAPVLGACLEGRALREVAAIDNDDQAEHGDLLTFAVAPDRRIGVAAQDGTVKLWTLEGFVGEISSGLFLYGAEAPQAQVLDLAFWNERLVLADVQGVVSAWTVDGGWRVLGGGEPGIAIEAVALDPARGRVAHASDMGGAHVMVRGLEDPTVFGPLPTGLTDVTDLAYLPDGRLVVAGRGASARLEVRDAADPTLLAASWEEEEELPAVREVALSGELVLAAGEGFLGAFDADLAPRWEARLDDHVPHSVAALGGLAVSVGAEGSLVAWSAEEGTALARIDVTDPITVRMDPVSGVILVGSRDGAIRAFGCE